MKNTFSITCLSLSMLMLASPVGAGEHSKHIRLENHVPQKATEQAKRLQRVEASELIHTSFVLPLNNQQELQKLIERIYDPADQNYNKYLSSKEFIDRFSPTEEQYQEVIDHAKSMGLKVEETHANRILLHVSGDAQTVESAFNVQLHHYVSPTGHEFYAPDQNPEVPAHLASKINGVVGLHSFSKWRPYHRQKAVQENVVQELASSNSQTFPSGPGRGFAPNDLATAYNLTGLSTKGTNQVIALFELASYQASDIDTYASYFGLPSPKLTNILVSGGSNSGIDAEVTLDIELALALAPESQIYVYEGPNSGLGILNTYNKIATDNIAKQISTSWGIGENEVDQQTLQAENAIFQQMAAQGQTVYAASGDSGAYGDYPINSSRTVVVDDPASQPYVVGVGGTSLKVDAQTGVYQSESVWNDGLGNGAGGGGVSSVWPIPSWQTAVSTLSSKTYRNVPDVTLNADQHAGYAIYYNGKWQIFGGTSCAAPLWAAFTACVNQQLAANQQPSLGFANPKLYAIGAGGNYNADFHDITVGNNLYYNATMGYDNASGWGSFNGANLFASLINAIKPSPFNIILKHDSPFTRGKLGTYKVVVANTSQSAVTGSVSVTVSLPSSISFNSYSGSGWLYDQNTLTFTQQNALKSGASYPTLILNVNVAANAPSVVTPTATVFENGYVSSTVSNLTTTR